MSRKNNNASIVFPIVLKTIIAHTYRDDATFAKNDKQIRATLRAKNVNNHIRNTSWIAMNMREYDAIRRAYDLKYDAKCVASSKRHTKTRVAKTSNVETSNVENVE